MFSRPAVFALFYLSGIAGLIYQVLWLRRLSVVFGVTVYAASTVLAAFMAGLAIGSALSGRVLRRGISPLAAFGVAEILIGVTGLLSPLLLDAASAVLRRASRSRAGLARRADRRAAGVLLCDPRHSDDDDGHHAAAPDSGSHAAERIGGYERQLALRAQHARRDDGHAARRIHPHSGDRNHGDHSSWRRR